jgi:hypothetical protein
VFLLEVVSSSSQAGGAIGILAVCVIPHAASILPFRFDRLEKISMLPSVAHRLRPDIVTLKGMGRSVGADSIVQNPLC